MSELKRSDLNMRKYQRFYPNLRYVECIQCKFHTAHYARFKCNGGVGWGPRMQVAYRKTLYLCEKCVGAEE
mgnify:CR=1 FL=1